MARTAVTRLQQQIDEVRREGFAAGYATAMQAIRKLVRRPSPEAVRPRRAVCAVCGRPHRQCSPLADAVCVQTAAPQ